ncbi:MAG: hypothetical protein HYY93_05560 [Planctomycetes bacterium]|nr:hypothetical protein [Planctomycetota bacterium]
MRRLLIILVSAITAVGALTAGAAVLAERWEAARSRELLQRLTDQEGRHSYLGVARLSFHSGEHQAEMRLRLAGRGVERAMEVLEHHHSGGEGGHREHDGRRGSREPGQGNAEVCPPGPAQAGTPVPPSDSPSAAPAGERGSRFGSREGRGGGGPFRRFGADFLAWQHRIHDIDLLFQNYEVRRDGRESVAGRLAERVIVKPLRPGRPSRTMWIDPESGFLLAAETVMPEDGSTATFRFDELEFQPEFPPGTFETDPKPEAVDAPSEAAPKQKSPAGGFSLFSGFARTNTNLETARAELKFPVLLPQSLPAGFAPDETAVLRLGDASALHLVYTDGLATLSLFEYDLKQIPWLGLFKWRGKGKPGEVAPTAPVAPGEPVVRRFRMGPVAVLQYEQAGTNVALIGSIPSEEMVAMLGTLKE